LEDVTAEDEVVNGVPSVPESFLAWMREVLCGEIDEASADGLVAAVEVMLADPGAQDICAEILHDNGAPKAAALFVECWEAMVR